MDFENMNVWCWLIPLLTGVICGILGYLIGRSSRETIDNTAELNLLKNKNAELQADLDACNGKLTAASTATAAAAVTAMAPEVEQDPPFDAAAAQAAMGKVIKKDDLKVVEGIGPKIASMFHEGGINTWKALSETAVARCQEILDGGGERYKVHDPASWPMQAKMCYEGKWTELAKWQDEHDHGKL